MANLLPKARLQGRFANLPLRAGTMKFAVMDKIPRFSHLPEGEASKKPGSRRCRLDLPPPILDNPGKPQYAAANLHIGQEDGSVALLTWIGIGVRISQSAMLSGLNLAFFSVNRLELQIEVRKNNPHARRVLALREDANFLLVTILWGNVSVNVLLALLSGSVLTGVLAFLFSTVVITLIGEIAPQAYFSRHGLRMGSVLSPLIRFYQLLLFPVARPTALLLDRWLGPEAITYFKERDIRELIKLHMASSRSDIERVEGQGALNFLALDDIPLDAEGEPVDPRSIVSLPFRDRRPLFPPFPPDPKDEFLQRLLISGKKWIVLVDEENEPQWVLDSDEWIRDALFGGEGFSPYRHCHRPIIARSGKTTIGKVISLLRVKPAHGQDDVVDDDVILLWAAEKRIVTGADVLGRLLRGIVQKRETANPGEGESLPPRPFGRNGKPAGPGRNL